MRYCYRCQRDIKSSRYEKMCLCGIPVMGEPHQYEKKRKHKGRVNTEKRTR